MSTPLLPPEIVARWRRNLTLRAIDIPPVPGQYGTFGARGTLQNVTPKAERG